MKKSMVLLLITLLLSLALPVNATESLHSHPACGSACHHEESCDSCEYVPLTGSQLTSGCYYLTGNSSRSNLTIQAGETVHICLNGHSMAFAKGYGITVQEGASLVISDCQVGGQIYRSHGYGNYDSGILTNNGTLVLYGVDFCLNGNGVGISNNGEMAIYGGSFGSGLIN